MNQEKSDSLTATLNVIRNATNAIRSIAKTGIARRDRLSDVAMQERLNVCSSCPGGHAEFRRGKLWTCGKMISILKATGNDKPCGCVLNLKARDAKEDCPFGYWPKVKEVVQDRVISVPSSTQSAIAGHLYHPPVAQSLPLVSDVENVTSPTGRTRRLLNVANRRERIQFRKNRGTVSATKIDARRVDFPSSSHWTVQGSILSAEDRAYLYNFFDRVVVVNLDRRSDRLVKLDQHLTQIQWPFRHCERFRAIDGSRVKPPNWWRAGAGAWGCLQSHLQIIEQAMMDNLDSILILEDDVFFESGITNDLLQYLKNIPDDWQQIYLGGQHLFQRKSAPSAVNQWVVRPYNVNRTHAYAVHRRGMEVIYRWLTNYPEHSRQPNKHIDHRLGDLHSSGQLKVYAPSRWLAGQVESHSNIKGKIMPTRMWNPGQVQQFLPFVAVIGLHRSGSSCLAGVLHKLGVHMGDQLTGYEQSGGFEARGLARLCEMAYPFPATSMKMSQVVLVNRLRAHIQGVYRSAAGQGKICGGKYPHLCAMGEELRACCGDRLKVIHIDRPIEESIASLKSRSRQATGFLSISDEDCENVQRWLWQCKTSFIGSVSHLTIRYDDLLANPAEQIERIVGYLGLTPSGLEREAAIKHVRAELRKTKSTQLENHH